MTSKHTPTPWAYSREDAWIYDDDFKGVLHVNDTDWSPEVDEANALFAVRAVNSHDALVEALRSMLKMHEPHHNSIEHSAARAALAAASPVSL